MSIYTNTNQNSNLAALQQQAPQHVVKAIRTASEKTGVDFSYLLHKAGTESSFRTDIKAKTSSATGLFQFIDSTWLEMVNKYGDKYGLAKEAAQIDNDLRVSNNAAKRSILHLRKDPELSSLMAAEYAAENKAFLERTVGGRIGNTELYLAHFMGPSGAAAFINEHRHNPSNIAADIFPREALANRGVFFDAEKGRPRTLEQVYAFFDRKFEGIQNPPLNTIYPEVDYDAASMQAETRSASSTETERGYQHIPPSLYEPVRTRGNWNKSAASEPSRYENVPSFGTRIARTSPPPQPVKTAESNSNLQVFPQALYSKLSISPIDVEFMRRLNG